MKHLYAHRKKALCAGFCVLTLCSLSLFFGSSPEEKQRLLPFTTVWVLAAAGLWLLFRKWVDEKKPLSHVSLWLLAAVFAGIMTLAQSFSIVGTAELLTAGGEAMLKTTVYFIGRVVLYTATMVLLQSALTKTKNNAQQSIVKWFTAIPSKWRIAVMAGLLLLCWMPYYYCIFPGVVSNDSITQIKELIGVLPLSNGNPIFQTYLLGVFCKIGRLVGNPDVGIALYCSLQGALMAVLFAYSLHVMMQAQTPQWLVFVAFGLYALCPVFPLYSFCVGKDTNFAMATLYLALMLWRVLTLPEGKKITAHCVVGLCVAVVAVTLLRNPGIYLAALALVLLLGWTLLKKQKPKVRKLWLAPICSLLVLTCTWALLHVVIIPLLHAAPMPETEEYSLPIQQVARVVASQPESISAEDRQAIAGVLDYDRIRAEYNGELSDPIKFLWNESASPEQTSAFFRTWLGLLRTHPATCFSATFHNTYGYLCPGYMSTIKPTLLIGKQGRTTEIDGVFPFSINPHSDALHTTMDALSQNPLFRVLLTPGVYGWIALFAAVTLLTSRRKQLFLAAVPALFTLMGCLLSAVNGYFRYAMPLYFSAPLLLALCAQALRSALLIEKKE